MAENEVGFGRPESTYEGQEVLEHSVFACSATVVQLKNLVDEKSL